MKIPFYQTQWHGIDLVSLAKKINHPLDSVADSKFYAAFYQELLARESLSEEWKNKKREVSNWLLEEVNKYGLSEKKLLSIGAGTGIVEMPLIDRGIKIDLYDVQADSFAITEVDKKTNCYTGETSKIPHKYDALVSIAACYTLSDAQIEEFFLNCTNLLNKNGIFIILDTSLSWYEIYSYIRNRQHFLSNYLLWGKKRSIDNIVSYSKKHFLLKNFAFYDDSMKCFNPIKFLNVPLNITPTWQSLVLVKRG